MLTIPAVIALMFGLYVTWKYGSRAIAVYLDKLDTQSEVTMFLSNTIKSIFGICALLTAARVVFF